MGIIHRHRPQHATARGFTLIELMITVAIVAVLGAVAYPSYQESVRKSRRAEARVALMEVLQQQERYMTQYNSYLAFTTSATDVPFKNFSGSERSKASYLVGSRACTNQTIANCVEVFATPTYTDPWVTELRITSTGVKACTSSKPSVCWN